MYNQEFKFFLDRCPRLHVSQDINYFTNGRPDRTIMIEDVDDDDFTTLMMKLVNREGNRPIRFNFKLFDDIYKYDDDFEISMAMRSITEGTDGNVDLKDCVIVSYNHAYTSDEFCCKITFTIGQIETRLEVM